jgi:hypothetical protein
MILTQRGDTGNLIIAVKGCSLKIQILSLMISSSSRSAIHAGSFTALRVGQFSVFVYLKRYAINDVSIPPMTFFSQIDPN